VSVPFGCDDAVAVTAFETCGYRALAFMDNHPVLFVDVPQHIVTGNGMTAIRHDIVLLDGFFRQFQYLLGIDFLLWGFFFGLFLGILAVFVAERESQELLPVGALFLLECIFIRIAQYELLAADGDEQFVSGMEIVQTGELVQCSVVHAYIFILEEFGKDCFTLLLIGFGFLAQDRCDFGTCACSGGIHFPFRLYAL